METFARPADDHRVPWKVREVEKRLRQEGWTKVRQSGSHQVWKNEDRTRTVIVAGKGSDTIFAGTLSSIRQQTGIEDFR